MPDLTPKRVLNVGGNADDIHLPPQYAGFKQLRLDIDPAFKPDILCDGRELKRLDAGQFDAVYCSHNLEHYYPHEVPKVLGGFLHVLKDGGFAQILVPDVAEVMRLAIEHRLDVEDVVYVSEAGPVTVRDLLWGFSSQIERTGEDFFAHKTGVTQKSLGAALQAAGFGRFYTRSDAGKLEVQAIAFKTRPDAGARALFGLPDE
jgi:SAM-dependent methyltransferase